jgi:myosin heavy subunit
VEINYISITRANEVIKYDRASPFINPITINVNDMAAVEDINEIDLLSNLKNRFYAKSIFTNVGNTLILVNPYQNIPGIFGEDVIEKFLQVKVSLYILESKTNRFR